MDRYLFSMVLMTTLISPLTRIPCRAPAKQRRRMAQMIIFLFLDSKHRCLSSISSSTLEDSRESFSELSCPIVGTLLLENIPGKTLLVIFCMESSTALIFSSPFLASDPFFSPVLMNNIINSELSRKQHLGVRNKVCDAWKKSTSQSFLWRKPLLMSAVFSCINLYFPPSACGRTPAPVELCLCQSLLAPAGSNNLIVMHQHFPDGFITITGWKQVTQNTA